MVVPVTERAQALHARAIVIDGCSFFLRGYNERLAQSGVTAINFTVPMPQDDFPAAITRIADYYQVAQRDRKVRFVWAADDIRRCKAEDAFGVIVGCQNSRFIGTDLSLVEVFWRLGLRVMQLTYNERNFAGDGCLEPENAGVSFFGRRLIERLNAQGIVLDLSHCGIRSSLEAIQISQRPVIMSHVGIRAFVDSPRAVSDEQIHAVAESGGVVGITSHPNFNWRGGPRRPHLNDFLDGIEHGVEVAGIDHIGIGSDYVVEPNGYPQWMKDYLSTTYDTYSEQKTAQARGLSEVMGGVDPREDQLEDFTGVQHLPRVTQGLLDRGFSEMDVEKVLGGNFLRVFQEVWRTA